MVSPAKFLAEVRGELSKVIWPTRPELIRLTALVIGISLIVGIYIGGLDLIFTKVMEVILQR
ncbi:MAG: preprotein translocase subunit SecE [bacterium]|nr:preprotein translocase subunit SecE [bacterium]